MWLPGLGQHGARVMAYHFRHLPLTECQLDELWTFVYKKEEHLDAIERLAGVYGEAWIGVAFAPVWKLVPAWVVGKRTLRNAKLLVKRLRSTDVVVRLLSLRPTPSCVASTTRTTGTDERAKGFTQEMARAHTRYGRRVD